MNPRSAAQYDRINVARSITRAIFSSPCDNLILSTTESIVGNVDNTAFDSSPGRNSVNFFGSNVSVCAIPPAIQRTITASAVGFGFAPGPYISGDGAPSPHTARGHEAASADNVAAEAPFKKSRREYERFIADLHSEVARASRPCFSPPYHGLPARANCSRVPTTS